MTIWPAASLLLALTATPAWAEAVPTAEPTTTAQHDQPQGQQPRRDRARAAPCTACANPAARSPITEAPNRGLMMIPAAHLVPARPRLPDWGEASPIRSFALATTAHRPPMPHH